MSLHAKIRGKTMMFKQIKRFLPFLFLLILCVVEFCDKSEVFAANSITNNGHLFEYDSAYKCTSYVTWVGVGTSGSEDIKVSANGDKISYSISSGIYTKWNNRAGSGNGTLTITNTTGSPKKIAFKWYSEYDTALEYKKGMPSANVTVAGADVPEHEMFSGNLGSGESIVISAIAHGTEEYDKSHRSISVCLDEFTITEMEPVNITIAAVTGAVINAISSDGQSATISKNDQTFTNLVTGNSINLDCTVQDGYAMKGWMLGNTFVKDVISISYSVGTTSIKVYPVILPENYPTGTFEVSGIKYDTWDTAMSAASSGELVTLRKDYKLPTTYEEQGLPASGGCYVTTEKGSSGNNVLKYSIPSNVRLLVPYDDNEDIGLTEPVSSKNIDECTYRNGGTACTTANKTFEIPQNTKLVVDGTLIINAKVSGNSTANEGTVFGTYGKMIVGGDVTINGTLYARGYIVDANHTKHADNNGTGYIQVSNTGCVYMPLQIFDYRGGSASSSVYNWIFPISQYKFQNIMVRTEYMVGASMYGQYFTSVGDNAWTIATLVNAQLTIGSQQLIGNDTNSFIQLTSGSVITDYDYDGDQLIISVKGSTSFNDITVSVTASGRPLDITTSGKQIPIPYGVGIKILDGGTVNFDKEMKILPGSWVKIFNGGTLNILNGGSVYLYAKKDYNSAWSYGQNGTQLNVPGLINKNATTWNNDAKIIVEGNIKINGTIVESNSHSGGIVGADGGVIEDYSGFTATPTIYEIADNNTDKVTTNWNSITGILAGLSNSSDNNCQFKLSGTGKYYAKNLLDDVNNAVWYQWKVKLNAEALVNSGLGIVGNTFPTINAQNSEESIIGYVCSNSVFTFSLKTPSGYKVEELPTTNIGTITEGTSKGTYNLSGVNGDATISVKLKQISTGVTYSVNISWDQTETAVYTSTKTTYTWNLLKLFYDTSEEGSWNNTKSVMSITLDNTESTGGFNATFTYDSKIEANTTWTGLTDNKLSVAAGQKGNATFTATPTEKPAKPENGSLTLGTITITLNKE